MSAVLLLKCPGTNCDHETARALEAVVFRTRTVPIVRVSPGDLAAAPIR